MTRPISPARAAEALGVYLRRIREGRDVTLAVAAKRVRRPASWLSRLEYGKARIRSGELETLLRFYEEGDESIGQLVALNDLIGMRRPGVYREYSDVIDRDFSELLELELAAEEIRTFDCQTWPGWLQTRTTAEEILRAGVQRTDDEDTIRRVGLRLSRRAIFDATPAPAVHCIVAESVLLQQFGGPAAAVEQLRHVLDQIDAGRITLQVMPAAKVHAALNGGFILLKVPPPVILGEEEPPTIVAYQDAMMGCLYHREPSEVAVFERTFDELDKAALSPKKSIELLHRMTDRA